MRLSILTLGLLTVPLLHLSIDRASAAEKTRDWRTGRVLDSQRNRYFVGTETTSSTNGTVYNRQSGTLVGSASPGTYRGNTAGTYQGTSNTEETAVYKVYETFFIEGDDYAYLAQERLRWRWSKPANLTVNGSVKFAIEKRALFVVDENGKEHELEIVKKTLRLPTQAPNNSTTSTAAPPPGPAQQAALRPVTAVVKQAEPPKGEIIRIVVRVTSTPNNAEVDVDGSYWGATPTADLTRLSAGTHTITVKKIGYQRWERKIDLATGDDRTVNAELEIDPTKPHIVGLD